MSRVLERARSITLPFHTRASESLEQILNKEFESARVKNRKKIKIFARKLLESSNTSRFSLGFHPAKTEAQVEYDFDSSLVKEIDAKTGELPLNRNESGKAREVRLKVAAVAAELAEISKEDKFESVSARLQLSARRAVLYGVSKSDTLMSEIDRYWVNDYVNGNLIDSEWCNKFVNFPPLMKFSKL